MIRRVLLLTAALLVLIVPAASAQTYGTPGITTSAPLVPGATVTVSACCYVPGTVVTFTLRSNVGPQDLASASLADLEEQGLLVRAVLAAPVDQTYTATAGPDGVASVQVTVPADADPGTITVSAAGDPLPGSGTPANQAVTEPISGDGGVTPGVGTLPVTGTERALPLSLIAALLLAGGGLALLASRRRARDDAEATASAV